MVRNAVQWTIPVVMSLSIFSQVNADILVAEGAVYEVSPTDTIQGFSVFENLGQVNNSGYIEADFGAVFQNFGTVSNNQYMSFYFNSSLDNYSRVINNYRMNFYDSSLLNFGEFENNSRLEFLGDVNILNTGYFTNNGDVEHISYSAFNNTGRLANYGTITSDIVNSGEVYNINILRSSYLVNDAAGIINNEYVGAIETANLLNEGEFNNSAEILFNNYLNPDETELNNAGVFNNSGKIGDRISSGFVLRNSGTFNNEANPYMYAGLFGVRYLENSGVFNNNSSLEVNGNMYNHASGQFNNINGYITLYGKLTNQGEFNNSPYGDLRMESYIDSLTGQVRTAEIVNAGVFNNSSRINSWDGLIINNTGEFNNSGLLEVYNGLVINNMGTFNNNGEAGSYLPLRLTQNSRINNYRDFNNYAGIEAIDDRTASIFNTGNFNNYSDIRSIQRFTNVGMVTNRGNIETGWMQTIENLKTGVINNQREGIIVMGDSATLDNNGLINNQGQIIHAFNSGISNSGTVINDGDISGYGDITNTGTIINNEAKYIAANNILSDGGLIINNGMISADNITIGGVLQGNGDVEVANGLVITQAGTLAPGNSVGYTNVYGDLSLDGVLEMEFDWTSAYWMHDVINVNGAVTLGENSVLDISFLSEDAFYAGDSYDLMFANAITGSFTGFYYDPLFDGSLALEWEIYNDFGQDILRLNVVSAVPLPAAAWLFISGLFIMLGVGRRRVNRVLN